MKIICCLTVTGCLYAAAASCQWAPCGARSAGMAGTSTLSPDAWSVNNNQGAMAFCQKASAGICLNERFAMRELGEQSFVMSLPVRYGVLGTTVTYTGDHLLNRSKAGLAYAMTFGSRFAAGIQLDYLRTGLGAEFGNRSNVTFEAGVLVKLSENLVFGSHLFNPVHVTLDKVSGERIPAIMTTGLGYSFSEILRLYAEGTLNTALPPGFAVGAEYEVAKHYFLRAGVRTNPFVYSFGFGLALKSMSLDISSAMHETLGVSPSASLQFEFGK